MAVSVITILIVLWSRGHNRAVSRVVEPDRTISYDTDA